MVLDIAEDEVDLVGVGLSFAITTALRLSEDEDVGTLLEAIAEAIRQGEFTLDDS
jgi:hypothetical protein